MDEVFYCYCYCYYYDCEYYEEVYEILDGSYYYCKDGLIGDNDLVCEGECNLLLT